MQELQKILPIYYSVLIFQNTIYVRGSFIISNPFLVIIFDLFSFTCPAAPLGRRRRGGTPPGGRSPRHRPPEGGRVQSAIGAFAIKRYLANPQITKAQINYLSRTIFAFSFSARPLGPLGSSMLVGISETIRLLLTRSFHNNSAFGRSRGRRQARKGGPERAPGAKEYNSKFNRSFSTSFNAVEDIKQLSVWGSRALKSSHAKPKPLSAVWGGGLRPPACGAPKHYPDNSFNEWLAGLIDGDGCFLLSKKGYASLEIVMELRDQHCLYKIKQIYGGSIKLRAGQNYLRYRLHDKKGLLFLINSVNGLIRNSNRILQLGSICEKYKIELLQPQPLTYHNAWLSGFLDSDGSIYLNLQSDQLFITASQKNKYLLDPIKELYGGEIYVLSKVSAFKWTLYRKYEILSLQENYIKLYPLKSAKRFRFLLLPKYYELRSLKAHLAPENSLSGKAWKEFLKKWESYSNPNEIS